MLSSLQVHRLQGRRSHGLRQCPNWFVDFPLFVLDLATSLIVPSGKGLPITEKLRPLIASQVVLVTHLDFPADLLHSPHNRWNWL